MIRLKLPLLMLAAAASSTAAAARTDTADVIGKVMQAEFALQAGQLPLASERYAAAAAGSQDPALAERATRVALAAEDRERARIALAHWRLLASESTEMQALAVSLALRDGEFETAMELARQLLTRPDELGWPLLLRSLAESRDDARIIARAVLAALPAEPAMPERIQPWLAFAGLARRFGDAVTSGRLIDLALARFPDDASARLLKASQQRERGDAAGARLALIAVLESPGNLPPGLRRAAARELAGGGEPQRAAELLGRGRQSSEDFALRASWLISAKDRPGLQSLRAELLGANALALPARSMLLGHIAEALTDWPGAERWYRQVLGEGIEIAQLRLARVLQKQGRLDEALQVLRALQGDEQADGEKVREAFLAEARMQVEVGRVDLAQDALRRGLVVFEDDPLLADALIETGAPAATPPPSKIKEKSL